MKRLHLEPSSLSESSEAKLYDFNTESAYGTEFAALAKPELSIGILLWPEFPLLALAGLIDALRHAADMGDDSKKKRCSWIIMSADPAMSVFASSGIGIKADNTYLPPSHFNYIAVIGGLVRSLQQGKRSDRQYIHQAHQAGVPVIGVCTGSFILADEGLLVGRRASIHPFHFNDFRARYPTVKAKIGCDFIDEGKILTCPGGIATVSLAAELIRRHCGSDRAAKAIHQISVPSKIDATPISVSRAIGFTQVTDTRLRAAVFLIEQSLIHPLSLEWLASQVGLSIRQLTRLFNTAFGKTPREFIRAARLRYASWLLINSTESVTEIALRTGFSDCAHFIRHFKHEYGCTPGQHRTLGKNHPILP